LLPLIVLAGLLMAPPAQAADIQIGNGDFDKGLIGWSGSHSQGGVTAAVFDGRTTAQISDTSATDAYGRESQPALAATAGTRYAAFARVWVQSGSASLYLRFRDVNGNLLSYSPFTGASTGQWNNLTVTGQAPAGTTRVSALIYSGVANQGTAYWDEVLISKDVTDLGVQIESSVPNGTTFAGTKAYAIFTGTQAISPQLGVIDLAAESVTQKITIPGNAIGGWAAATASDGRVYLGTYSDARLYRHTPGQSAIQDLGKADGGNSVVWDLEPGANGDIYGGTSANQAANFGSFFKYANNTLTTIKSPVVPDAQYVRAIAHDPAANVTYLGVGSPAALIRSDTNADILPAAYRTSSMVGGLTWTGNRLIMSIDGSLVVMNGTTVEATIPGGGIHHSPARNGKVWFTKDDLLHSYDIATKTVQATGISPGLDATGYTWLGDTLVALGASIDGTKIFKYNTTTAQWSSRVVAGTPLLPAAINAVGAGPDGKIYTGGFLTGGTGVYDPMLGDTNDTKPDTLTANGLTQTDSLLAHNGKLYIGTYPSAGLHSYDGTWPPQLEYSGGSAGNKADDCEPGKGPAPQDRPLVLAGGPSGTVYMGTVPKYGKRSGALTVWQNGTGQTICVAQNHVVASLAYAGGQVFGGTSTRGALGVEPPYAPGETATLFSYDGAVTRYPLPSSLAGVKAITALAEVDGDIWGLAGGTLITLDPANPSAITTKRVLTEPDWNKVSLAWRDGVLLPIGQYVYGTLGDSIFRISKASKDITVLRTVAGMEGLTKDDFGNLYYRIGERLHRFVPPA
jgi:hypothetical protein